MFAKISRPLRAALAVSTMLRSGPALAETLTTSAGEVSVDHLAKLDNPWSMASLPNGDLLISEKPGHLRIYANGALSEPVAGVPKVVFTGQSGQGGLLGIAVDPKFSQSRLIWFAYVEAAGADQQPGGKDVRDTRLGQFFDENDNVVKGLAVARARLGDGRLEDVQVIWRQAPKMLGRGHFGGRLAFAPDGMLLVTAGERQRFEPAQDVTQGLGKVIRIRPDGSPAPGNPFADQGGEARDVLSYGHRNPQGIAVRPGTDEIWEGEMGPFGGDEVNLIAPGANYGWPLVSEGNNYDGSPLPRPSTKPELRPAVQAWYPSISPTGMSFYEGDAFRGWKGSILMGGLSSESVIRVSLDGRRSSGVEIIPMGRRIRDVMGAADGSVLVLVDGDQGELLRLAPR